MSEEKPKDEKRKTTKRIDRVILDFQEDLIAHLPRGFLYRLRRTTVFFIITGLLEAGFLFLIQNYPSLGALNLINPQEIVSLIVAEIPIGVFLWLILQRRESESRRILDAVEVAKAVAKFEHLIVHASDPWFYAAYPEKHYFIVNANTRKAYFAPDYIYRLVRAGIIKKQKRYRTYEALLDHFKENKIDIVERIGEGSDLGLKES